MQLARAEADGYHFQPTLFAMLVMDAFDQVALLAQLKGIHLVHDLDEADEGMVSADQSLLTRALFNVLENAIKYSPSGTTVRLRHGTTEGWLECRISDQGPGIAEGDLPELFSQYHAFADDTTAMAFHDGLDHGQPQPQAVAALGRFETAVLAEQLRQVLGGDAWALIADAAFQPAWRSAVAQPDGGTRRRILDGVFQDVEQGTGQQRLIGRYHALVRLIQVMDEMNPLELGQQRDLVKRIHHQHGE